jgi:hypothetical protein
MPGEVKLHPVRSSHVDRVGYDADSQSMHVFFKDGSHYEYHNVPHLVFTRMLTHESPGKHFNEEIKGSYRKTRHETSS